MALLRAILLGQGALIAAHMPDPALAQASVDVPMVTIEPEIRVSPPGAVGHFFGFGNTKADPTNPNHLITCGIRPQVSTNSWQGYLYSSDDGGREWRASFIDSSLSRDSSQGLVSESSCAMSADGKTYFTTSTWDPTYMWSPKTGTGLFRMYHSADAEHTWSAPAIHAFLDNSRSVVDNSQGPYHGRLYVFGDDLVSLAGVPLQFDDAVIPGTLTLRNGGAQEPVVAAKPLLVSEDGGQTIRGPVLPLSSTRVARRGAPRLETNAPFEAVALRDGTALVVYASAYQAKALITDPHPASSRELPYAVEVAATKDGGRSLTEPVIVRRLAQRPDGGHAAIAVGAVAGSLRDRVYASWDEAASVNDKRSIIQIAWSDDDGETWSGPSRVDDAPGTAVIPKDRGEDPEQPSVAVNPSGLVGVSWVERDGTCWRFAVSQDRGKSFAPSAALNACPRAPLSDGASWAAQLNGVPYPWKKEIGADFSKLGLTVSPVDWRTGEGALVATGDGVFHPTWTLRYSTGELWTTRIHVGSPLLAPVSVAGRSLVTEYLALEIAATSYDETVNQVKADVMLVNKGDRSLTGPFVLEVKGLTSDFGAVELVNSDGGGHATGAVIDFASHSVPHRDEDIIPPHGRSIRRRLVFHLDSISHEPVKQRRNFVSMTGEIYGR